MPEYDGSQFLSDTQLLPQRTAVIIGAEMHDFHTGKGFSHPLQVVFGFFFQIIDDLVLLYMRNFGEVFFSQSFPEWSQWFSCPLPWRTDPVPTPPENGTVH